MPWVTGPGGTRHRSHRFPGGYDEQMLGRAVEARAELVQKPDALLLKMVLRAQDVGHKVPTGDLFRSLVLDATLTDGNGNPLPGAVSVQSKLARTFGTIVVPDDRGELRVRRHQLRDDRLVPGEDRVLTLRLPLPAPRREKLGVRYRLRLFRLPPGLPRSGTEGEITKVKEGLLLASPGETS